MKLKIACLVVAAALAGCASFRTPPPIPVSDDLLTSMVPVSLRAVDQLAAQFKEVAHPKDSVYVVPAREISSVHGSSTLGRVLTDQLAGRLSQHGFKVLRPAPGPTVVVASSAPAPSESAASAAATAGTAAVASSEQAAKPAQSSKYREYAVSASFAESTYEVLVTLEAVDLKTGTTVTAYSYSIPTVSVHKLLRPEVAKVSW